MRDGEIRTLAIEEVVVGDLLVLEMGDEIPADGRLVKANELFVDQSLLMGEPEPVRKQVDGDDIAAEGPDLPGCLYRGTQVTDGAGQMVVTDVGDMTMIGQIARRLSANDTSESPASGRAAANLGPRRRKNASRKNLPSQSCKRRSRRNWPSWPASSAKSATRQRSPFFSPC